MPTLEPRSCVELNSASRIWGQAISASVPYGLTRCEEFGHLTPGRGSWETNRAPSVKLQAASNKQLLLLVHYHKRQAIYPAPSPTTVQGYRILKDLSRKLFSLIHKKRFDKYPVIGYNRIISPLPCRAIQNLNRA